MLRKRSSPSFFFFFILSYPLVFPLGSIFQSHDVSIPQLKVNDISQSKEDKKKKSSSGYRLEHVREEEVDNFVFFIFCSFCFLFPILLVLSTSVMHVLTVIWKQRISILSPALFCPNIGTVSSFLIPLLVEQSVAMWNKIRRVWSVF